jgi:hypothetical protein
MQFNSFNSSFNSLKTQAKKAGGGITLTFDSMTGVTLHTGTPGWIVYTISNPTGITTAITRTITASVSYDTSINIVVCGGGGGSNGAGWYSGGGGGGRFREASKLISALTPTQTFTCTIPAIANGMVNGGTSSITFSVPTVGDISCGGGGYGWREGGGNAPANGGSGGGGGATSGGGWIGGTGAYGYNGGRGDSYNGNYFGGGGGGAGGNGGDSRSNILVSGTAGPGVSTLLAGILSVYPTTYKFCGGGGNAAAGSGFGGGAESNVIAAATGRPGAVIIAVPA